MRTLFAEREQKMAWLGLILYIPAIVLVSSGVTYSLGWHTLSVPSFAIPLLGMLRKKLVQLTRRSLKRLKKLLKVVN